MFLRQILVGVKFFRSERVERERRFIARATTQFILLLRKEPHATTESKFLFLLPFIDPLRFGQFQVLRLKHLLNK